MPGEFELLQKYAWPVFETHPSVRLGPGDDCAVTHLPVGYELCTTTDMLVAGRHFPMNVPAHAVAYKAIAVNLSDLAAMGATPLWIVVALSMPHNDEAWFAAFTKGIADCSRQFGVHLIGGDLTCGPMSVTVTAMGMVPQGKGLLRSGAQVGDKIFVSGTLGDAALGLTHYQCEEHDIACSPIQKLCYPTPRLALGKQLLEVAHSAIDISDGFLQDLNHILKRSGVGAVIYQEQIPLSDELEQLSKDEAMRYALTGGDDYELLFTVPENQIEFLENMTNETLFCVGEITEKKELMMLDEHGKSVPLPRHMGYEHFV